MPVGQPKTGRSLWRDLTECGPLEKGMANHFSILAKSQGTIHLATGSSLSHPAHAVKAPMWPLGTSLSHTPQQLWMWSLISGGLSRSLQAQGEAE